MTAIGFHLSSEEHSPGALVDAAARAEAAGFDFLTISDHYHPWTRSQGSSPFVWSILGAIAQVTERVAVGTAVTAPIIRTHPAVIAQATATTAVMLGDGRFFFGVGTGERLNEGVTGERWPSTAVRREMLEEAVEIIRALWTGEMVRAHEGRHYRVERARLFTLPETPPPIVVSGFGPRSIELAGRIGDGYMGVTPDAGPLRMFRAAGGEGKPAYGKLDVCWAGTEEEARRTAFATWPNAALQGEVGLELPTPEHIEQAVRLVTEDRVAEAILCSPDPERFAAAVGEYADAGYSHVTIQQCGPRQREFVDFFAREVMPRLGARQPVASRAT
jgi:G6PDH family F420-dependent oxidoreductase